MSGIFGHTDRRDALRLGVGLAALSSAAGVAVAQPLGAADLQAADRDRSFDDGWRFLRGDGTGFEQAGFDDKSWRAVTLPHDWSIEDLAPAATSEGNALWSAGQIPDQVGPFDKYAPGGSGVGYAVGGTGWYRKSFSVPDLPQNGRVEILFDGVFMNSDVWLNGHHLGNRPYGYTAFAYDLTPHLDPSGNNVIAVRVRNLGQNSRWYSGSGIYRQVKLAVSGPVRFARWGVAITTGGETGTTARVDVTSTIEGVPSGATVVARVFDPQGRNVAEQSVAAGARTVQSLAVRGPQRWSPESPVLYTLQMEVRQGGALSDRVSIRFGIRKVEIDAKRGLRINGRPCKLRGANLHHDNGILGAAAFPEAEERRVALLKARGFNAIRTSHNPPSAAFLDACDRLGMLVMDEAFDVWNKGKGKDDYSTWFKDRWRADLAAMILRDRNHPSVIMWSIGNEIPEKLTPEGNRTAWELAQEVRRLDPTRPITAAVNGFSGRPVVGVNGKPDQPTFMYLDVAGYNYRWPEYVRDHPRYPDRVMLGGESYPNELFQIWPLIDKLPYVIGDFVWTGMDHLGEAGLGANSLVKAGGAAAPGGRPGWPWVINAGGDIDLIGHQKPPSLARDVLWGVSPVEVLVQRPLPGGMQEKLENWSWPDELPSWTWPGREGKAMAVRIYTMGDRVELSLNGKPAGSQTIPSETTGKAEIAIPYAPGELVATAWRGDRQIGVRRLITTGAPAALRIVPYRTSMQSGGLAFLTVEVLDNAGRFVDDASVDMKIAVDGPAALIGFGSGNPRLPASYQQDYCRSFRGRSLAVLRGLGKAGQVTVTVSSSRLASAGLVLPIA